MIIPRQGPRTTCLRPRLPQFKLEAGGSQFLPCWELESPTWTSNAVVRELVVAREQLQPEPDTKHDQLTACSAYRGSGAAARGPCANSNNCRPQSP